MNNLLKKAFINTILVISFVTLVNFFSGIGHVNIIRELGTGVIYFVLFLIVELIRDKFNKSKSQ